MNMFVVFFLNFVQKKQVHAFWSKHRRLTNKTEWLIAYSLGCS